MAEKILHMHLSTASIIRCLLPALLLPLMLVGCSHATAGDIYVIAHPAAGLSAESIRDIYIGEKQSAGAIRIIAIDNAMAQVDFLQKVLKLDSARYAKLWLKKSFREGLNPPAVKDSDKEIVDLVRRTPGAIAYVTSSPPPGVTVLRKY